ncbi:hypothetical protein TNIN_461291 [Trichonephila inaurata madagascariensis]|uniref:Uncharacterized protein n=1 Tax=Trichonephila inaurata madagascariensis TaxID=2747483 RepID=A0A8X6YCT7_9ARAC|nr:hypothetical protein TNIN_461291 [Trichonephila inaurata madagascariensis]
MFNRYRGQLTDTHTRKNITFNYNKRNDNRTAYSTIFSDKKKREGEKERSGKDSSPAIAVSFQNATSNKKNKGRKTYFCFHTTPKLFVFLLPPNPYTNVLMTV